MCLGAIEDLRYNGPGVGLPKVPFKCERIEKLLYCNGIYSLSEDNKKLLREYIHDAKKCNGGCVNDVKPGHVQQRANMLIEMVQDHANKIPEL